MLRTPAERFLQRPGEGLAALALLHVALWTALPALGSLSPTLDVVEVLAWGQEWQLGYFKHPPLPAWLAEIGRLVTGEAIWGPILVSQLCVAATFVFVFLLGRGLLGGRDALLGTALLTGVYYFSWPTPEFNHNVVQMPIWAAAFYLFALICENPRRLAPWAWLGMVAGLGVYAKYSVAVLYAVLGLWLVADRRLRPALLGPGPWLGAVVAIAVALPHLLWLVETGFLPIAYAQSRSAGADPGLWRPFGFLLTQAADHLPMLVPLAVAFLPLRRLSGDRVPTDSQAIRFLAIATFAPVLLTVVLALVTRAGLKDMWGAPMFTTSGLLAVALLRRFIDGAAARRMLTGCLALLVVLPVAYALQVPAARWLEKKPPRNGWPMARITEGLSEAWHRETGSPLQVVGGDPWIAGLVSAGSRERPSVRYEGPAAHSPWIGGQDLRQKGLLLVWFGQARPQAPEDLQAGAEGRLELDWPGLPGLDIGYAVYPPQAPAPEVSR